MIGATAPHTGAHSTPIRTLLRQTVAQFFFALHKGIKSLGTPKGLLATIPLIVSLIAFLKASYATTNLFVLFIQPISMEVSVAQEANTITRARANAFEMVLIEEGREDIYATDGRLNIAIYDAKGHFNQSCGYEIPGQDNSTQVVDRIWS